MKEWWTGLDKKDRRTLIIGGIALGVILFYFMIWSPALSHRDKLAQRVDQERQLLSWMHGAAAQVKALRGNAQAAQAGSGSLLSLAEQSARQAGLNPVITTDRQGVRVTLEKASFDDMIRWLAQLHRKHGVQVVLATVRHDDNGPEGRVDVQLILSPGGSA